MNGYQPPVSQMGKMSLGGPPPGQFNPGQMAPPPGQMAPPIGQMPGQIPGQIPGQMPGQIPGQMPGQMPGMPPSGGQFRPPGPTPNGQHMPPNSMPNGMPQMQPMGGQPQMGGARPPMGGMPGGMPQRPVMPQTSMPNQSPMGGMTPTSGPRPGMPGQMPGQIPGQIPGQMPGQIPGQMPGQMGPPRPGMPGQNFGQMPGQMGGPPRPGMGGMPPRPGMGPPPGGAMPGQMPPRPGMPGPPGQMGPPRPGIGGGMGGYPQQNQKLDPDSIPSPLDVMRGDQEVFNEEPFIYQCNSNDPNNRCNVPPACTSTIKKGIQETGNCSPRYCRSSLYSFPSTSEMAKQCQVPMTISISAMAEPGPGEAPLLDSDFGSYGPLRCKRCKAYVCPQFRFIDGGRSFQCHLCQAITEVPQYYFQMTDHMGYRMDRLQRPELCRGSYEFVATKDYCKNDKLPEPPGFIFAIDVSYNSIRTGLVNMICNIIPAVLDRLPRGEDGKCPVKVGFLTYGHTISFFNLSKELSQPQMMVVGDVEDIFVPLQTGFMVDPDESRENINTLLKQIPQLYAQPVADACFLPVVQAAAQAFSSADRAGKLFMFHSSLPTANAPGKLQNRDDRKLIGSDKEKFLFQPADKIYEKVGKEMVAASASVELFVCPSQYSDVASMAHVCHLTGGTLYKYTYFNPEKDQIELSNDLIRAVTRPTAFDAIMKVRTTAGIRAVDFIGSFYMTNTQDIELAGYDADKSVSIELKHDDKLNEQDGCAIQIALLYTNIWGQRKLRIHNLQFGVITQLADIYKVAETDTLINYFAKLAIRSNRDAAPQKLKEGLINRFCHLLAIYRKHCADPSSIGQLILPERLKVMPAYMSSVICDDSIFPHHEVPTDDRAYLRQKVLQMTVDSSCAYFYPCVYQILNSAIDPSDPKPSIRCSYERFKQDQIYVIENGLQMFIWIGQSVSPTDISSIWGVNTPMEVLDGPIPVKDTENNSTLRTLIDSINSKRRKHPKQFIVRCGHPDSKILEGRMRRLMVEDPSGPGTTGYVDFLIHVHREIRQILS